MPSRSGGLAQTWGASLPTAEPTLDTRRVLGLRMADCVPYGLRGQRRTVVLNGKIRPPSGPIGSISFDLQMILKSCDHGPDLSLQPSPALLDCLSGLWLRCRDANTPFRGVYARLEPILDRMADPIDGESTLGDPMGTSRDAWSTLVVLEA